MNFLDWMLTYHRKKDKGWCEKKRARKIEFIDTNFNLGSVVQSMLSSCLLFLKQGKRQLLNQGGKFLKKLVQLSW